VSLAGGLTPRARMACQARGRQVADRVASHVVKAYPSKCKREVVSGAE
jgi:hypothetical protein